MKPIWKKSLMIAGIAAVSLLVAFLFREENKRVSKSIFAMDTYMQITAYGKNSRQAVDAAIKEIKRLDDLLSTGNACSEVSVLNQNKKATLSEDVLTLLMRSVELWHATQGAFDITIYPVMRAWGFAGDTFAVPASDKLAALLPYVDASVIQWNEETRQVLLPQETEIDFGGIAKGYTSERVAELMGEYGIKSAILDLGGNVQTVGSKPDGSLWKVAIKSPDSRLPYLGILELSNQAVITSGGYERYFEVDGKTYHHIIDPKTGWPAENGIVSVTIVSKDATLADGLSTGLFVMGIEKAIDFWRTQGQTFEFVIYEDTGRLLVSEGLTDAFLTTLEYEVIQR